MNEPEATLRALHVAYCRETGDAPPYESCERRLLAFHNAGFAVDELVLVVHYIRHVNRQFSTGIRGFSLRFGKLFEQAEDGTFEHFGDMLGSARGWQRKQDFQKKNSYPAAKAEVLRATGRPDAPAIPEPQQAKQVMDGLLKKGFEDALKQAEQSIRASP